jgi:tRNA (cmo5U34)-methyltransferase
MNSVTDPVQLIAENDHTKIPEEWTFKNTSVAENFDHHVRSQLPWYDLATGIVQHFGRHYLAEGGRMYDLGASTGNITLSLSKEIESRKVEAISVDNSPNMGEVWRGVGEFRLGDITTMEYLPFDFGVAFLLFMFLPPASQEKALVRALDKLNPGGCFIVFDKTDQFQGYLSTVVHRLTLAGKVSTGVSSEEIIRKELSLAGVQRPIRPEDLGFASLGATEVFRFGEFAGWAFTK